jgi:hypothetical protein
MRIFTSKKGQGTTEYIVILAVVLVALLAFWPRIKGALQGRVTETVNNIGTIR